MTIKDRWQDLKTIILYSCTRTEDEKTGTDIRYYISSMAPDAEKA